MGILFPGFRDQGREDGLLMPDAGTWLAARRSLRSRVLIIGGQGDSIVPAVQQYVRLAGLPPVPPRPPLQDYARLASAGWLDTKLGADGLFRHALWPGFGPQPAADAACYMAWLAGRVGDREVAERLMRTASAAIRKVQPKSYYNATIGHVRLPVAPLVFGAMEENIRTAETEARSLLTRFEPDGRVIYRPVRGKPDLGKTHFAQDANGLTAQVVEALLRAATFAGDPDLITAAVDRLHALDRFAGRVPRGAQTWEVPLHTPDILAAAHLVRAYTLGYQLTGEADFLRLARYWGWSGLPFVYLVNPTDHAVGPYSTIAVFGATSWVAPVWMGLPVQWCGLVYADALYHLGQIDPQGPWLQVADGITAAGIEHTWPRSDPERQGLLPDSFVLRAQRRDGPAINPGTLEASAAWLYRERPLYDFKVLRNQGWLLHAPGAILVKDESPTDATVEVRGWPEHPYFLLVQGCRAEPRVWLNGRETALIAPHSYRNGHIILQLEGTVTVRLQKP